VSFDILSQEIFSLAFEPSGHVNTRRIAALRFRSARSIFVSNARGWNPFCKTVESGPIRVRDAREPRTSARSVMRLHIPAAVTTPRDHAALGRAAKNWIVFAKRDQESRQRKPQRAGESSHEWESNGLGGRRDARCVRGGFVIERRRPHQRGVLQWRQFNGHQLLHPRLRRAVQHRCDPVDLTGFKIQYFTAAGGGPNTVFNFGPGSIIGASDSLLIVTGTAGTGGAGLTGTPTDGTNGTAGGTSLAASAGTIRFVNPSNVILDTVGWGTAAIFEGTAVPQPASQNNQSMSRNAITHADNDNNAGDFTLGTPSPNPGTLFTAVTPEPASLAALAVVGGLVSLHRRRRRPSSSIAR